MGVSKFFYYETTKTLLLIKARSVRTVAELSPTDLFIYTETSKPGYLKQWGLSIYEATDTGDL